MQPLARTGTADVRTTTPCRARKEHARSQAQRSSAHLPRAGRAGHESGHKRDDRQIDARDPRFPKDGGHTHTCMYICQDRMGNEPCGTWRTDMCMYMLVPICKTVHSAEWSTILQNGNRVDHSAEWTRPGAGVHTTTTILQIGIAETFLQMGI